jgi:hypothetical protein
VFAVHVIDYRRHSIGKVLGVGIQEARLIPASGPTIIEVEVAVPCIEEANFDEGVGCSFDAEFVAKIKDRMISTGAERYPRAPS